MITYDHFLKVLRDVVGERPDHYYSNNWADSQGTCVYFIGKSGTRQPSCLLGHVFEALLPDEVLNHIAVHVNDVSVLGLLNIEASEDSTLVTSHLEPADLDRIRVLATTAQARQDNGSTWAMALYAAEKAVAEVLS